MPFPIYVSTPLHIISKHLKCAAGVILDIALHIVRHMRDIGLSCAFGIQLSFAFFFPSFFLFFFLEYIDSVHLQ